METRTHRRTVLRTGVRLVYAAPIVAATLQFNDVNAQDVVSDAACPDGFSDRTGRIVDSETGEGIEGATFLFETGGSGITDQDGYFIVRCAWDLAVQGFITPGPGCYAGGVANWLKPIDEIAVFEDSIICYAPGEGDPACECV